jgi:Flp pilus assembly protein TadG
MLNRTSRKYDFIRHRFMESDAGSVAAEFALLAAPFIALIVGAFELFVISQAQAVLETSAETVGRQILTGTVQMQGLTQSQFQTLVCNAIPALLKCKGVMVDVQVASSFSNANISPPTITYDKSGNVSNNWQFEPGSPQDIVVLRIMYQWPVISLPGGLNLANQSNGSLLLMATSVFKNESYQ